MSLPEKIWVKISSEQAESISLTPVVRQEMPLRDVVGLMLNVTGKDPERVAHLLGVGQLVSGASRFRWEPLTTENGDVALLLQSFPNPDPARPFSPGQCISLVLHGAGLQIPLTRETAARRKLLRHKSFWDVLLSLLTAPSYSHYSYKDQADVYTAPLAPDGSARLQDGSRYLAQPYLARQIRATVLERVELLTRR